MSIGIAKITERFTKQQLIFISVSGAVVLIFILLLVGIIPGRRDRGGEQVELVIWGVDDEDIWRGTINGFREIYPSARPTYKQIDEDNYEDELINALAAGNGPDIFMFKSSWLGEHKNKIIPAPEDKISMETFSALFPQVAEQDFILNEKVYSMPLFIDTLALFYNRDILDRRGIVFPPETWEEFEAAVPKLREIENGRITLAAAAIGGTSETVLNSYDILSLLMLQSGVPMVNSRFDRADIANKNGERALEFYAQFANPQNPLYTWDGTLGSTIDSFSNETSAMIFAYQGDIEKIEEKNPFLDFDARPVPQISKDNPVNVARYYGLSVSAGSDNKDIAWDFVVFATTDRSNATRYVSETGRPPALRFLINDYINNPEIGVFSRQALTAKSWLKIDEAAIKDSFDGMIGAVLSGELDSRDAIRQAESEITTLMRKK